MGSEHQEENNGKLAEESFAKFETGRICSTKTIAENIATDEAFMAFVQGSLYRHATGQAPHG